MVLEAFKTTVNCEAFEGWLPVSISIAATTHITFLDFSLFGTAYTFTVTRWSGKGLTPFLQNFHDHIPGNEEHFGKMLVIFCTTGEMLISAGLGPKLKHEMNLNTEFSQVELTTKDCTVINLPAPWNRPQPIWFWQPADPSRCFRDIQVSIF